MSDATVKGIITKGVGGLYTVRPLSHRSGDGDILCRARGIFRHERITPTPGDIVEVELSDTADAQSGAAGTVTAIGERRNCLIRPPVANLTNMLLVVPAASPKPDLFYVDKLTAICDALDIHCTVVVNKRDIDPAFAETIREEYTRAGFPVFLTDAVSGEGCDELLSHVMKFSVEDGFATAAFAGVSGAGKSSIMGRLFPEIAPEVGAISRKTERGRHTTRAVELYPIGDGLFLADTPGFSMLDFERFDFFEPERLTAAFREFEPYLTFCRYADCTHIREEDCAVLDAVKSGEVSKRRHDSFVALYETMKKKPDWQRRQKEDV